LRLDLAENSAVQHSSDWCPHQQHALERYPEKHNLTPFSFEVFIKLLQVLIEDRIRHPSFRTFCMLDFQFAHVLSLKWSWVLGFADYPWQQFLS